jgi:hypothetical protein
LSKSFIFIGKKPLELEVKLLTNGTVFLVYSLVKNKSKIVATPKARANPLIGPIASTYRSVAADNETKSAVKIVFHASVAALSAAN